MLIQQFDFKVAKYLSPQEIDLKEIVEADILEFSQKVPGGIYHSQEMQWFGDLTGLTDFSQLVRSKKENKALEENKNWFLNQGYTFKILPVTEAGFKKFVKLYQQTTLQRERPQQFSLEEQILGKVFTHTPVFLIGMFKERTLESALVFSVKDNSQALVSFGAKKKFPERRGGVGGVLEQMLVEFCLEHGIKDISHGRSKNPVGLFTKSGVFEFKARYGFSVFPAGPWKTTFLLNPKIVLSDLIFVTIIDNEVGYLVVSDRSRKEVEKRYITREISRIEHVSFQDVQKNAEIFLSSVS